jgi:hypothetical protein
MAQQNTRPQRAVRRFGAPYSALTRVLEFGWGAL